MGSKNNPGDFDCYDEAKPDEPMFVLLGRDPAASTLVRQWVFLRERYGAKPEQLAEARACAEWMEQYARDLGKGERVEATAMAFHAFGLLALNPTTVTYKAPFWNIIMPDSESEKNPDGVTVSSVDLVEAIILALGEGRDRNAYDDWVERQEGKR